MVPKFLRIEYVALTTGTENVSSQDTSFRVFCNEKRKHFQNYCGFLNLQDAFSAGFYIWGSYELYIENYGLVDSFQLLEIIFPSLLIMSSRSSPQVTSCLRGKNRFLRRLCNVFCLADPISSLCPTLLTCLIGSRTSKLFVAAVGRFK